MSARALARAVRVREAVLMVGFPAAAGAWGVDSVGMTDLATLAPMLVSLALLAVSVYAYNTLAGLEADADNPKFADSPVRTGEVTRRQLRVAVLVPAVLGTAVAAVVSVPLAAAVVGLWAAWMAYSHPRGLKGVPVAGSMLHLAAGVAMFTIPYLSVRPADLRCGVLATVMALAFAGGHANQEVMDRRSDAAGGVRTTAVALGAPAVHRWGLVLFSLSYVAVAVGWAAALLIPAEAVPFLVAAPVHLGLGLRAARGPLTAAGAHQYRTRYRALFAAAVAASVVGHLLAVS